MTHPILLATAAVVTVVVTAGVFYALGRTKAVKATSAWKLGYASGHTRGLLNGAQQRDEYAVGDDTLAMLGGRDREGERP